MRILALFLCCIVCVAPGLSSKSEDDSDLSPSVSQATPNSFYDTEELYKNWNGNRDWLVGDKSSKLSKSVRYTVWDLEFTGGAYEDKVIQISGYEIINGEVGKSWHSYINPGARKSSTYAEQAHKLAPGFLSKQPKFEDIFDDFMNFVKGSICLFHNASSDIRMLAQEIERLPDIGQKYTLFYKCTRNMIRRDHLRSLNPSKVYFSPLKKKIVRPIPHDVIERRNKENRERRRLLAEKRKINREKRKRATIGSNSNSGNIPAKKVKVSKSFALADLTNGIKATDVAKNLGFDLVQRYDDHSIPQERRDMDHDAFTDVTKTLHVVGQLKLEI